MYYKIFNIPIPDSEDELERLNKFLGSVRVISTHKELVSTGSNSYWSFVIEYYRENDRKNDGRKHKVDYKEILSEEDFAIYSKLRELRKEMAEQEGIPVYAIFTNEQLADIVKKRVMNKTALSELQGIGDKKIEKYGNDFLQKMKELYEAGRKSV